MKYKRYPSYKDSGVEWLGDVPTSYIKKRLKFLGETYGGLSGKAGKDFNQDANDANKKFIPFTNIANNRYIKSDNFGTVVVLPEETQNRIRKNDLFFLMSSEDYDDLGKSSLLDFDLDDAYLNSFCKGFRIDRECVNPRYLNYLLSGDTYRKLLQTQGNGFTRINLRLEKLRDLSLFIAHTTQEQKSIANYLDKATSKIDTLIEKQTKLIELLKEKRQAVISSAVTRGLDASVPMKDSGVEWLGEIPEHWGVKKLKYVIRTIESGTSVNAANTPATAEDIGVLKTSCVYSGKFRYKENKTVVENEKSRVTCPLKTNTLIVSRMNTPDLVGAAGWVAVAPNNIFLPDRLWQVHLSDSNVKYIHYLTLTNIYRGYIHTVCAGTSSSMQNLSQDDFKDFMIAVPDQVEQKSIANYLDKIASKIDNLITKSKQSIDLLKEKRTALISAAVTGKIDVRDAA